MHACRSTLEDPTIGGADYKLYMQPVPLSLLGEDGRHPDQWVVCGLVRADRFHAESSALSFTMVLWFSAALAIVFLAVPFVKLQVLRPRERLRASDAWWVESAGFAAINLLAVALLDVYVFAYAFPSTLDARLRAVSDTITGHLQAEVAAVNEQAETLDVQGTRAYGEVLRHLTGTETPALFWNDSEEVVSCEPKAACKTELRKRLGEPKAYPYANLTSWIGKDGWQRVKWTPGVAITPFINLREERVAYYEEMQRAWHSGVPQRGVSVVQSPNTGEPLTVFWRVGGQTSDDAVASSESLATFSPIAFDRPMLPKGVSFAVVDRTGRVLFHSDATRSLQENFLKECGDNPSLSAAIVSGQAATMKVYYLGRLNHLHVRPLPLLSGFKDPEWTLITFQDAVTADTVNLETVTIACLLLAAYGVMFGVASWLVSTLARVRGTKWFWPAGGNGAAYSRVAQVNGVLAIGFVCLAPFVPPAWSWWLIVAIAPGVLFATSRIVLRSGTREAPRGFGPTHPFFFARATFLLVVAGLPALACFQVAYVFETKLLATSEHRQKAKDIADRDRRIDRFVARFSLRDAAATQALKDDRSKRDWDRAHVSLWQEPEHRSRPVLDSILARLHQPYNEVAVDLRTAASSDELSGGAPLAAGFAVVAGLVGILFGVCYAFVFFLVKPLFVMDAVPLGVPSVANASAASRLLTIGPPGAGKSVQLPAGTAGMIFDVARLAYVDRRGNVGSLEKERRGSVAAAGGSGRWSGWSPSEPPGEVAPAPAPADAATWADVFDYGTLPTDPNATLAVDHVDHRLEERDFAAQTLRFIERVVHGRSGPIRMACDRYPLVCLRDSGAPAAELDRWVRALASFQIEIVGVDSLCAAESQDIAGRLADNPLMCADQALDAYGVAAAPAYEAVWRACTADEQLALYQLAQEGLVNPQNQRVVQRLMRVGLIVRNPLPGVMTETFRRFVLQAASSEDLSARERAGIAVPWGSVKAAMLTIVFALAGLLVVTQQQLVSAWVGFVPTLLPAAQRLYTLFASLRPEGTGDHTA